MSEESWVIAGGPMMPEVGEEVAVDEWVYVLEREGRAAHRVRVVQYAERGDLPEHCESAIASRGLSAVEPHLDEDAPPERILITLSGLVAFYGRRP